MTEPTTARPDLTTLTDDDLVRAANAGLLKRAVKELGSNAVVPTLKEDGAVLVVEWSDAAICRFPPGSSVRGAFCSCGATEVCRHLIRSCLYLRAMETAVKASPRKPASDLVTLDEAGLLSNFGKSAIERARKQLAEGLPWKIDAEGREVEFPSLSVRVRFPIGADKSAVLCSCRKPAPCQHLVPALLLLRGERPEPKTLPLTQEALTARQSAHDGLRRLLVEWMRFGLDGLSTGWHESAASTSIALRQSGLIEAADLLASLRRQIRADVAGEGQVEPGRLRWLLAALWLRVAAPVENAVLDDRSEALSTETFEPRDFVVFGASAWWGDKTLGIIVHLLDESTGRWLTVGTGRPIESKAAISSIAAAPGLLGDYSARELLGRRVTCSACGFTAQGRLRLLAGGKCGFAAESIDWPALVDRIAASSIGDVVDRLRRAAPELITLRKPDVLLFAPARWSDAEFSVESQAFRWAMQTKDGAEVDVVVRYRRERALAIASLRRLAKEVRPQWVLGRLSASESRPVIEPVTLFWRTDKGISLHQVDLDRWPRKETKGR